MLFRFGLHDYLYDHTDDFVNWLWKQTANAWTWTKSKVQAWREQRKLQAAQKEQESIATETPSITDLSLAFDTAFTNYQIYMDEPEVQKRLLDIYVSYIRIIYNLKLLANAQIIDRNGRTFSGKELVDKVTSLVVISQINRIIFENPALLDQQQALLLSEVLGQSLILEKRNAISPAYIRRRLLPSK